MAGPFSERVCVIFFLFFLNRNITQKLIVVPVIVVKVAH